jgi:hypothetical protein
MIQMPRRIQFQATINLMKIKLMESQARKPKPERRNYCQPHP